MWVPLRGCSGPCTGRAQEIRAARVSVRGEVATAGGGGWLWAHTLSPHPLSPGQHGGHGRDAAGAGGWETAQRAARPLAAGSAGPGRAETSGAGGGRPADPAAAHRRFLAALPARPGFRSGPGLARKCSPGPADLGEGRIHAHRAWGCGCRRAQTPDFARAML